MRKQLLVITLVLLVAMPMISLAANRGTILDGINPGNILPGDPNDTIGDTITAFILLFLQIVGLITVAYIIYGGFRYVTSGGSDEVTKSAKKTITNAIIGLVIVLVSYIIVTIVTNTVFGRV